MPDNRFMRRAIDLAAANVAAGGGPFGAVVVRGGEIIAEGVNRVAPDCDPTAHAEVSAIRAACARLGTFSLEGCDIYASCEPCPMCLGAIYWARIDHLFYGATKADAAAAGFDDSFIYGEFALPPEGRNLRSRRLLEQEALAPFRAWACKADKTTY